MASGYEIKREPAGRNARKKRKRKAAATTTTTTTTSRGSRGNRARDLITQSV